MVKGKKKHCCEKGYFLHKTLHDIRYRLKRLRGERVKMLNLSNLTGYKKLILYQKAKDLVLTIYRLTEGFPKTEIYTLVPQMRRAAISIMANIVEGYSKGTSAEYARFLTISIGSLTELEVYLDLCLDLEYITQTEFEKSFNLLIEVKKLLYVSRKTIRERIK